MSHFSLAIPRTTRLGTFMFPLPLKKIGDPPLLYCLANRIDFNSVKNGASHGLSIKMLATAGPLHPVHLCLPTLFQNHQRIDRENGKHSILIQYHQKRNIKDDLTIYDLML